MVTTTTESIGSLALTVVGCTGNGVSPIVLTVSTTPSTVEVGQQILVAGVGGNTNANGSKLVTAVDDGAKTITFAGTGNGAYTTGGTVARNYATLELWNSAHNAENLVTLNRAYVGQVCMDDSTDYDYAVPAGTFSTIPLYGCTTDSTHYRELTAAPGHRWNPIDQTGVKITAALNSTNRAFFWIHEGFFRMSGMCVSVSSITAHTSDTAPLVIYRGGGVQIDSMFLDCRVSGSATTKLACAIRRVLLVTNPPSGTSQNPTLSTPTRLTNCIFRGSDENDVGATFGLEWDGNYGQAFNCAAFGVRGGSSVSSDHDGSGFYLNDNTQSIRNCVSIRSRGGDFTSSSAIVTLTTGEYSNNASSDATASSVSSIVAGAQFNTYDNLTAGSCWRYAAYDDFRNLASSSLVGNGASLIGVVATDFAGSTRTQPWDIGPYSGTVAPDTTPPTIVEVTVGSDISRDYATIQDALDATVGHLVAANEIRRLVLYPDSDFDTTGAPGNTITASGSVSDSRRYREIVAAGGYRYDPPSDYGVKIVDDVQTVIEIAENNVRIEGVKIHNSTSTVTSVRTCLKVSADGVRVDSVTMLMDLVHGSDNVCLRATGDDLLVSNCIAVGGTVSLGATIGFEIDGADNLVANCVAVKIRAGATGTCFTDNGTAGTQFTNCAAGSSDIGFVVEVGYQDHNASVDATADGVGSITGIVPADEWSDVDSLDFRLISTGQLVNAGTNLAAEFTTDINGATRYGVWEIGPYAEYLAPPAWAPDPIGTTMSLVRCWTIERTDGVTLNYTDNDEPVSFRGLTFEPAGAFVTSSRRAEAALKEHSMEARGALDTSDITYADLAAGKYDDATVHEFVVDSRYPWTEPVWSGTYFIEQMSFDGEVWTAQPVGISSRLQRQVGDRYTKACGHRLGDSKCRIDLAQYRHRVVVVDAVSTAKLAFSATPGSLGGTAPSGQTIVDGWFNYGVLTWRSGANAGLQSEVRDYVHATREFALFLQTPYAISPGDTFDVIAGCDYLRSTCRDKFSNIVNHGGFPFIPGTDKTLQTPTR